MVQMTTLTNRMGERGDMGEWAIEKAPLLLNM